MLTSVGEKEQFPPMDFATSSPPLVGRSAITTLAPPRTKRATVARPRPLAPPVTSATTLAIERISKEAILCRDHVTRSKMEVEVTGGSGNKNGSDTFSHPGMVAFYIFVLVGMLIPVLAIDVLVLASICVAKTVAIQIRIALTSIILSALVVILALMWENMTAIVLATTQWDPPGLPYCAFILYLIIAGGSARFFFTATFCVIVFIVIRYGVQAVKVKGLIFVSLLIGILSFLSGAPFFSPWVVEMAYFGGVACFPGPSGHNFTNIYQQSTTNTIVVSFLFITSAVLPTLITTFAPCVTLWAFHKILHDVIEVPLKKALMQLALFLVFENIANLLGLGIPAFLAYFYKKNPIGELIAFCLCITMVSLSLFVTPIVINMLLKGVRRSLKAICLCVCFSSRSDESARLLTMKQ